MWNTVLLKTRVRVGPGVERLRYRRVTARVDKNVQSVQPGIFAWCVSGGARSVADVSPTFDDGRLKPICRFVSEQEGRRR
jgi:hypothetical protein